MASSSYRREEYVVAQQGGRIRDPTENLVPILTKVRKLRSRLAFDSIG
jgi:hypothetical protein